MTIYGKLITATFLLLVGLGVWYFGFSSEDKGTPVVVACTKEAKICPDGSTVGRAGPLCEFTECPAVPVATSTPTASTGSINGFVMLSPTCPVESNPPDPNCAPKPYITTVQALEKATGKVAASAETSSKGFYILELPIGTYTIQATTTAMYPRCENVEVVVTTNTTLSQDILCDSGIR